MESKLNYIANQLKPFGKGLFSILVLFIFLTLVSGAIELSRNQTFLIIFSLLWVSGLCLISYLFSGTLEITQKDACRWVRQSSLMKAYSKYFIVFWLVLLTAMTLLTLLQVIF